MQVNLKLFTPAPGKRRTVLLFVFRDRTRTPLARLVETWEEDLHRMWAAIPKPPALEGTSVTDFFEVPLEALFVYSPQMPCTVSHRVLGLPNSVECKSPVDGKEHDVVLTHEGQVRGAAQL